MMVVCLHRLARLRSPPVAAECKDSEMSQAPRMWISNASPKAGEVVRVRAQIRHRMESGMRLDADGDLIPRNIVSKFEARLSDDLLFVWEPETAITQHPYLEFTFAARKSED